MTFRGSIDPVDRVLGALPYLLPFSFVVLRTGALLRFPFLLGLLGPILPLMQLLAGGGLISFAIFIALFLGVVRNHRVPHFIRFNTIQAILTDIAGLLFILVVQLFASLGLGLLVQTLLTTLFLAVVAIAGFAWFQCARGHYADEVPILSDAAYTQVRD